MSVQHITIAGTTTNYDRSLFFDLMESGDVYLGLSRTSPVWGFSTLIKIKHTRTWATGVMGQANGGIPETLSNEKFYDINSSDILLAAEVPAGSDRVYIAYIDNNDDTEVIGNYTFVDSSDIGTLTLEYMNEDWARIKGFNSSYFENLLINNTTSNYDYYIFNYQQDIESKTVIEPVSRVSAPKISQPVRLMYTTVTPATEPTTAFGNNLIGDLVKTINIFGETSITGLNSSFVTDGNGYVVDNSLNSATFYLTTADGVIIQGDMRFVEQIENGNEISLIFSYPIVAEAVQNSGRLKITVTNNSEKLAVFSERFTDGTFVSDNTPPPLFLNYLKIPMFHTSILDVLGLVRIDPSEVDFARRIDNLDTEKLIFGDATDPTNFPGIPELVDSPGVPAVGSEVSIEVEIAADTTTTTTFAITNDINVARRYGFDLVRVEKTLDSNTPTSAVYRQLFVCYRPLDEDENDLDLSVTEFTHDDIFNETKHQYNLGTILYIANKQPVFREYLNQDEQFTLFI